MEEKIELYGISRLRPATDGTGIRTLICTYGCSLQCRYCINPLSWNGKGKAREYTLSDLYDHIKLDWLYWQATNGGITFGGGEPLLQAPKIRKFIETYCDGINIAMETSLNVPQVNLESVIDVVDDFFIDVKTLNDRIYKAYTGKDNGQVLHNLRFLMGKCPKKISVRVPMIKGYNDQEDCERTVGILKEMGIMNIECFEYLIK